MKRVIATAMILLGSSPLMAASYTGAVLYQLGIPDGFDHIGEPSGSSNGQVVGYAYSPSGEAYAFLWTSSGNVQLSDLPNSVGSGTSGNQQVGASGDHAMLWTGTEASGVDLNPVGAIASQAKGTDGIHQVGWSGTSSFDFQNIHAYLWAGTADSGIDLHPDGFQNSQAVAVKDGKEVGFGSFGINTGQDATNYHPLLWTGSASSVVDLDPSPGGRAYAMGVGGDQEVGYTEYPFSSVRAIMWRSTAGSAVNLDPANSFESRAYDTNGINQVGYYLNIQDRADHATVWSGTADSAVDLQLLLPASIAASQSFAYTIDSAGNIFGVAYAPNGTFAVEWSPVPEPAMVCMLVSAACGFGMTRRRSVRSTAHTADRSRRISA